MHVQCNSNNVREKFVAGCKHKICHNFLYVVTVNFHSVFLDNCLKCAKIQFLNFLLLLSNPLLSGYV